MEEPGTQRLTNEDFRKLMMTPRVGASASLSSVRETANKEVIKKVLTNEKKNLKIYLMKVYFRNPPAKPEGKRKTFMHS